MSKGPILAIVTSVIAVISLYLFLDIKHEKSDSPNTVVEVVDSDNGASYIQSITNGLLPENQAEIERLSLLASNENDEAAADSLIKIYELAQQYDIAAFYHELKAQTNPSIENWELAGDRQLSVSQNAAFDPNFNEVLYQKALFSYGQALNIDSNNLDIKVKLGSALVDKAEQPMQGITLLLEVIAQDSMHINANLELGKFGIISGQFDKSILRIEKVLSLQPENTEALFLAAEAESQLGNKDKAIAYLEKCKQLVENEQLKNEIDAYIQELMH